MLRLSKHFIANWNKRVGQNPEAEDINRMVNQAIRVQKGRQICGRTAYIKTLTIYWHADKNIIITVDHFTRTVVSVYSRTNMPGMNNFKIGESLGAY